MMKLFFLIIIFLTRYRSIKVFLNVFEKVDCIRLPLQLISSAVVQELSAISSAAFPSLSFSTLQVELVRHYSSEDERCAPAFLDPSSYAPSSSTLPFCSGTIPENRRIESDYYLS